MNVDQLFESDGLFQTTYPDIGTFVWRLLTLKEYKKIASLRNSGVMHPFSIYSIVFDRCSLVDPGLINGNTPAGVTINIGQLILWYSGDCLSDSQGLINDLAKLRNELESSTLVSYMQRVVLTAFPSYKIHELEDWSYLELIKNFSLAEKILADRVTLQKADSYPGIDLKKLSQILDPNYKPKAKMNEKMDMDNKDLQQAMGNEVHPLDRPPEELAQLQKQSQQNARRKLTPAEARKLDQRRR